MRIKPSSLFRLLALVLLLTASLAMRPTMVSADLRSAPVWYDQNAVGLAPDWHYRVPVSVPAGATVNSTVVVNIDFAAQLSAMGVSGTFDANSPRVVRSTGALSTNQQFTDTVFSGATDTAGNARGEVRFILQDAGAVTYWVYFDITQNGAKPANPQVPINGNFEFGTVGTATPTGWASSTKVNAAFDTQIVGGGTVSVTSDAATLNNPFNTNGNPNTGSQSYLIGARTNNEPVDNANATQLNRTIVVPASNPGNLTVRWKPQGWDSGGYDNVRVTIIGTATTQIIGPTAGNYATRPFAPSSGSASIGTTTPGYGAYNSWDMGTSGNHTLGMTVGYNAEPWWTYTHPLTAFAGQTVTLRIETGHATTYRSWALIDDIEWSVVNATLGAPQAFGTNITAPAAGGNYVPGQTIAVTAQVDAIPSAPTAPMTVAVFTSGGTQIGGPFLLYNDGTHGDVTAGDSIWSNNGSILADAVIVPLSATTGTGYVLRAFAKDGSTSTIGAQAGLIRGPGTGAAAETQANFWNIDEILFNVQTAALTVTKSSTPLSDPLNGTTNPKLIPGATAQYCILIQNAGALTASNLVINDPLPANVAFVPGTIRSGTSCAGAATVEPNSLITGTTLTRNLASLGAGASFALTLQVTIN
jgi:uncharacterized repeat protein (TIGR01451 family)